MRLAETDTNQSVSEDESSPAGREYARRLRTCNEQLGRINRRHVALWACFAIAAGASVWVAFASSFHWNLVLWPVLALLAAFGLLMRNSRDHDRLCQLIGFYESGLARLHGEWRGRGIDGAGEFKEQAAGHPYASDLNLFGKASLFEFLCTARTGVGRATLANWLLRPAATEDIVARQAAVMELRDQVQLRENWASLGSGALKLVEPHSLEEWAKTPPVAFPIPFRSLAVLLPLCLILVLVLAARGVFGAYYFAPVLLVLVLEAILVGVFFRRAREVADDLAWPSYELSLLSPLLQQMESSHFHCQLLQSLQSPLTRPAIHPSRQVRTLARLAWLVNLSRTEFAIFLSPWLTGTNLAMRIENWRCRNQAELLRWLEALGQFEALLCLARYSYENPGYVFPILRAQAESCFHAESLGHPLLDPRTRVACDLRIDGHSNRLVIVSGSNMSGKSTLLRSVGANAVLALAGAPVCAQHMELSPMRIACSISVTDSLEDNKSRFQAEVERLKQTIDAARAGRTLFLLDEMLSGTNSKDRLFGATAVINELIACGAIGLITTHDLALTAIADRHDGLVSNVHFEEHYADGEMRFDYCMRPGVLTRTNGANVMAALGLLSASELPT